MDGKAEGFASFGLFYIFRLVTALRGHAERPLASLCVPVVYAADTQDRSNPSFCVPAVYATDTQDREN